MFNKSNAIYSGGRRIRGRSPRHGKHCQHYNHCHYCQPTMAIFANIANQTLPSLPPSPIFPTLPTQQLPSSPTNHCYYCHHCQPTTAIIAITIYINAQPNPERRLLAKTKASAPLVAGNFRVCRRHQGMMMIMIRMMMMMKMMMTMMTTIMMMMIIFPGVPPTPRPPKLQGRLLLQTLRIHRRRIGVSTWDGCRFLRTKINTFAKTNKLRN